MTFSELKQKLLFRVAITYTALAWLIIQTIGTITRLYGWPPFFISGIIFMLIGGYPLIMLLAWAYELTHKTRGWKDNNLPSGQAAEPGKGFYWMIAGIVTLAIVILVMDITFLGVGPG